MIDIYRNDLSGLFHGFVRLCPLILSITIIAMPVAGLAFSSEKTTLSNDVSTTPISILLGHDDGLDIKSLDVYRHDSTTHILVAATREQDKDIDVLYLNSTDGEHWSSPVRVTDQIPAPHSPKRGKDIQIAAYGKTLVANWSTKGEGWGGSGPLVTAWSADSGKTWQQGSNPADDDSQKGHDFIDIIADDDGRFHTVWLDSRHGQQGLQYAYSVDGGRNWSINETVDSKTCQCCWNTLAISQKGTLQALYRDSDPRDMKLAVRKEDQKWHTHKNAVGAFNWRIEACPHNGGGLAEVVQKDKTALHAVIWTGKQDETGVHHLISHDDGRHWQIVRKHGDSYAGHTDIAADNDGRLAVVWEGSNASGKGTQIYTSISIDDARNWSRNTTLSDSGRLASHPRVLAAGDKFTVFWTEKGEHSRQMLVTLTLE